MIDEYTTFLAYGYTSDDLSKGSNKKVWRLCDICGVGRFIKFCYYRDLCENCSKRLKLSEEHKRKISKSSKGKIISEKQKQQISEAHTGRKHTEQSRKNMSDAHIGIKPSEETKKRMSDSALKGINHPWYNPNLTDEERLIGRTYPEYREWRKAIYERDNYMCQLCGMTGIINAHHIESYTDNPELRTELLNGITMCEECHKNFHHQYGNNTTKKQLIKFIGDKNES